MGQLVLNTSAKNLPIKHEVCWLSSPLPLLPAPSWWPTPTVLLPQLRPQRSSLLRLLTLLPRVPSQLLPHSTVITATTATTQDTLGPTAMAPDTLATMATMATHMPVPLLPTQMVPLSQLIPQPSTPPRSSILPPRVMPMLPMVLPHTHMLLPHTSTVTQLSTPLATQDLLPPPTAPLSQLSPLMSLLPVRSTWPHTTPLKRRTI